MCRERGKGPIGKIPGQSPDKSGKCQKNRQNPKRRTKKVFLPLSLSLSLFVFLSLSLSLFLSALSEPKSAVFPWILPALHPKVFFSNEFALSAPKRVFFFYGFCPRCTQKCCFSMDFVHSAPKRAVFPFILPALHPKVPCGVSRDFATLPI